ncbi:MAG: glutamine synthetase, partial [Myxococcales bacterium]
AGLYGIREKIEPPPPVRGNGYADDNAAPLPRSLKEAVQKLKNSRLARELLGDGFVDHYVRTREWEVRQFQRAVTRWELERYFEAV